MDEEIVIPERQSVTDYLLDEVQIDALRLRFPFIAGAIIVGGLAYVLIMGRKYYQDYND